MGVPTFFKWICTRYPKVIKDAVEKSCIEVDERDVPVDYEEPNPNGVEFDNLYLDMNGIIHPCCHPEDGLMPESEDVMFTNIVNYTDRLIRILRPRKLLYIAIDGVAPRAKMNQQRARRYRAAQEAMEQAREESKILNQFSKLGKTLPNVRQLWDSNVITPGTPFLERVGHLLRWYVADRMSNDPLWKLLGFRVIISDAHVPGEGEHKIMDFIRCQRMQPSFNPNTVHCLYGADADLIMLGLATHEVNFYIVREVVIQIEEQRCYLCNKVGHLPADCSGEIDEEEPSEDTAPSMLEKPFQIISIPILREYLEQQFSRFAQSLPFQFDFERCIDDFVFICFFVGNDFLPHLPSLSIRDGSVDQMIILYLEILPTIGDYLTDAGTVNLTQVDVFLEYLGKLEDEVFRLRLEKDDRYRQQRAQGRSFGPNNGAAAAAAKKRKLPQDANLLQARKLLCSLTATVASGGGAADVGASLVIEDVPATKAEMAHSTDEFYDQVRNKLREKQDLGDQFPDRIRLGEGSDFSWKQRYYFSKFKVKQDDIPDFVMRIRQAYIEGICWVLGYYYQGVPSWTWYYPYHYAPFASDLVGCDSLKCNQHGYFAKGEPFLPFHQLISVLPPRSAVPAGLPGAMIDLMSSPESPIIDFFPEDFALDLNGKKFLWQAVVLLPFIKEERLLSTLDGLFSHQPLNADEASRNRLARNLVIVPASDCLARQLVDLHAKGPGGQAMLADMPYTDARGHGTTLFGRIYQSTEGGPLGVVKSYISTSPDLVDPACVACEIEEPLPHPSRPFHVCQLLPGAFPLRAVLDATDHAETTQLKGFGGEPARRMILNVLQKKLDFHTQTQQTRGAGPSELSGPPAPRQQSQSNARCCTMTLSDQLSKFFLSTEFDVHAFSVVPTDDVPLLATHPNPSVQFQLAVIRRLLLHIDRAIIPALPAVCSPSTCPRMIASDEWHFLCAPHVDKPKDCPAIDYMKHTVDSCSSTLLVLLGAPAVSAATVAKQLSSIVRRVFRIFGHLYFHHPEIFATTELECCKTYVFLKQFGLWKSDLAVIPEDVLAKRVGEIAGPKEDSRQEAPVVDFKPAGTIVDLRTVTRQLSTPDDEEGSESDRTTFVSE